MAPSPVSGPLGPGWAYERDSWGPKAAKPPASGPAAEAEPHLGQQAVPRGHPSRPGDVCLVPRGWHMEASWPRTCLSCHSCQGLVRDTDGTPAALLLGTLTSQRAGRGMGRRLQRAFAENLLCAELRHRLGGILCG